MKPKLKKFGKESIPTVAKKASAVRRTGSSVNTLFYGDNTAQASGRKPRLLDLFFCCAGGRASAMPGQDSRLLASISNHCRIIRFRSFRRTLLSLTRRSSHHSMPFMPRPPVSHTPISPSGTRLARRRELERYLRCGPRENCPGAPTKRIDSLPCDSTQGAVPRPNARRSSSTDGHGLPR
jgi:hypothetical protein